MCGGKNGTAEQRWVMCWHKQTWLLDFLSGKLIIFSLSVFGAVPPSILSLWKLWWVRGKVSISIPDNMYYIHVLLLHIIRVGFVRNLLYLQNLLLQKWSTALVGVPYANPQCVTVNLLLSEWRMQQYVGLERVVAFLVSRKHMLQMFQSSGF